MKTKNIVNAILENGYEQMGPSGEYFYQKGDLEIAWTGDLILHNVETGAVATVINPLAKHQNEEELSYTIKSMEEGVE